MPPPPTQQAGAAAAATMLPFTNFREYMDLLRQRGEAVKPDMSLPALRFYNAVYSIYSQAETYDREGNWSQAYSLYWRCATMVTQLSKHPQSYKVDAKTIAGAQDRCKKSLDRLEQLLDQLRPIFETEQRRRAALLQPAPAPKVPLVTAPAPAPVSGPTFTPYQPSEPKPVTPSAPADGGYPFGAVSSTPLLPYIPAAPLPGVATAADAAPPTNDAPLLRYPQLGPRSTLPEYTYTPGPVPEPSATVAGSSFTAVPGSFAAVPGSFAAMPDQSLSSSSAYNPPFTAAPPPTSQWADPTPPLPPKPQYLADAGPPPPPLPLSLASADRSPSWPSWVPESSGANTYAPSAPPFVPTAVAQSPSASFDGFWANAPPVPPLDPAVRARLMPVGANDAAAVAAAGPPPSGALLAPPAVPRSLPGLSPPLPPKPVHLHDDSPRIPVKPSHLTMFDGGFNSLEALRPMVVPSNLVTVFAQLAHGNTLRNIETCGILCGRLERDVLIVSDLLVPKQTGTSDTCGATNEEDIFAYQNDNNLLTLGWIHTHPTQTCFLSSVDLHTHFPYQATLPEAIAIVLAPSRDPGCAYFRLTEGGLDMLRACTLTGFHPHGLTDTEMYQDVRGNAGAVMLTDMPLTVRDQR